MTHGVFPIEMFCCIIIVEILLILETKLQSCQVLTNKLRANKAESASSSSLFGVLGKGLKSDPLVGFCAACSSSVIIPVEISSKAG